MSNTPTLILQMQRMGDLIMTFPLMGYLQVVEPQHPLWVVAEPCFFNELLHLAPKATFFPPEAATRLTSQTYHRVINLSHRADAAALSGVLQCKHRTGPYTQDGSAHIAGFWQLYRSSLVHNNRHNLFHWTDLHILDCTYGPDGPSSLARITYPMPTSPQRGCVGIFTGASEPHKRPSPALLGAVAKGLLRKGIKPVFLGGPDDVALGAEAQNISGIADSNLCGRFSIQELASLMQGLDLFISADTGPMHLAVWTGTPTLNLSMGPVNAWETGPASPKHFVLRSNSSCTGCWQCPHASPPCHTAFHPARIVLTAHTIIRAPQNLGRLQFSGLDLLQSQRDERGLYFLQPVPPHEPNPRDLLSRFWQEFFIALHNQQSSTRAEAASVALAKKNPQLFAHALQHIIQLSKLLTKHLTSSQSRQRQNQGTIPKQAHCEGPYAQPLPASFWQMTPPLLRPLSSFVHLVLQNADYAPNGWSTALEAISTCATVLQTGSSKK